MNDLVERSKALGLENSNLGEWVLRIEALEKQRDELQAQLTEARNALLREGMQRDELLEALARTRNMIRSNPKAAENCANDAIASVKGGAA